jgi:hypothetical protein
MSQKMFIINLSSEASLIAFQGNVKYVNLLLSVTSELVISSAVITDGDFSMKLKHLKAILKCMLEMRAIYTAGRGVCMLLNNSSHHDSRSPQAACLFKLGLDITSLISK